MRPLRNSPRSLFATALCLAAFAFAMLAAGGSGISPLPAPTSALAKKSCAAAKVRPRSISSRRAAKAVACLVNRARSKRGMGRLKSHGNLNTAARKHSVRMQKSDCFEHQCPGEPSLSGRYQKADYLPCSCSWGAGENIAWGMGKKGTPRRIFKSWMDSPPHRSAILTRSFKHVGVGIRWGTPYKRKAKAGTYTLDFGYKR